MAIVSINTIKNWFKTGMIPTQDQFWSVFDSFRHKDDKVPVADVEGINELLATRASQQVLDNHLAQKGAPNGYAPLNEFTKLAAQYLNIVNDLVTGGATALLSAEQGKVLQTQISAINTLLTSDNVNLDTIQELVDAIETVQMSLSSILVNDLTTGGTTKALTAEMGKQLDLIKESTANKSTSIVVDYLSNIKFPSVKAVYDFCMSAFKKKFLTFGDVAGITHTFGAGSENTMFKFSNNNPITATIPTNSTTPFEIGTVFETIAIGNGALTVTGAPGVTILTNLSNTSVKNEVRRYTKIDTDTWSVEGNILISAIVANTFFVDLQNGNDATGKYQDSLKPFLTLQAALDVANTITIPSSFAHKFVILGTGTANVTKNLGLFSHNFECLHGASISFNNFNATLYGTNIIASTTAEAATPFVYTFTTTGTLTFGGTIGGVKISTSSRPKLVINVGSLVFSNGSYFGDISAVTINSTTTNFGYAGGQFINLRFNSATPIIMNLGDITSSCTGQVYYLWADSSTGLCTLSFKSLTALNATGVSFYWPNIPFKEPIKIGNINMPLSTSFIALLPPVEIDSAGVTSVVCRTLGGLVYSGGGNFEGVKWFWSGDYTVTLKNGIYRVDSIQRSRGSGYLSLINSVLYIKSSLFNDTSSAAINLGTTNLITADGFCKIVNSNASGTIDLFGFDFSQKSNGRILVNGAFHLERVTYNSVLTTVSVINTTTSIL
ncbi:hypothetical protein [Flavobacterium praedii]|uniref:hypothetical protein n=1 Tax=Flavobacterium praedii TaxID=3002900 RepID=UPI002481C3FF|nr:hypothetical protein [Flavobacterium praedii]